MSRNVSSFTVPDPGLWLDGMLLRVARIPAASDLVLEPGKEGGLVVRVRSEGVYHRVMDCPGEQAVGALGRLKALARLPAYITEEAQDDRLDGRPFGFSGELRVPGFKLLTGFDTLVLRIPIHAYCGGEFRDVTIEARIDRR